MSSHAFSAGHTQRIGSVRGVSGYARDLGCVPIWRSSSPPSDTENTPSSGRSQARGSIMSCLAWPVPLRLILPPHGRRPPGFGAQRRERVGRPLLLAGQYLEAPRRPSNTPPSTNISKRQRGHITAGREVSSPRKRGTPGTTHPLAGAAASSPRERGCTDPCRRRRTGSPVLPAQGGMDAPSLVCPWQPHEWFSLHKLGARLRHEVAEAHRLSSPHRRECSATPAGRPRRQASSPRERGPSGRVAAPSGRQVLLATRAGVPQPEPIAWDIRRSSPHKRRCSSGVAAHRAPAFSLFASGGVAAGPRRCRLQRTPPARTGAHRIEVSQSVSSGSPPLHEQGHRSGRLPRAGRWSSPQAGMPRCANRFL
jgi:hypothetical protein